MIVSASNENTRQVSVRQWFPNMLAPFRKTKKKNKKRSIKVIHAPLNYAGQAYALSQALRTVGVDSRLYCLKATSGSDAVDGEPQHVEQLRAVLFTPFPQEPHLNEVQGIDIGIA